jgi:hypothetical protein
MEVRTDIHNPKVYQDLENQFAIGMKGDIKSN